GHSVGGDIEYYTKKLADVDGPVLEAGVGTGRMLISLLGNGLTVDGVDISPDMLAVCKANLKKHNRCYALSARFNPAVLAGRICCHHHAHGQFLFVAQSKGQKHPTLLF
ncbi:MAG: class I SAM-dependent methyltransferase, partial [Defluviitaleaceae bacterium]|nr:class I SAM-dependent methyltransferase [Defluviitaleaceae bacterium]